MYVCIDVCMTAKGKYRHLAVSGKTRVGVHKWQYYLEKDPHGKPNGSVGFFSISRSMPTANAEDPCRSEGI